MSINKIFKNYLKTRKTSKFIYFNKPKEFNKDLKIAIIVPYRDNPSQNRKEHLKQFLQHFKTYLSGFQYKVFIIEQSDDNKKFNRGKLLNIGLGIAISKKYDILITHDVDLLPDNDLLPYYVTKFEVPMHIAYRWNKYNFKNYFGGIVSFTPKLIGKINGYPNDFWGWGGEDDSLYNRVSMTIGEIGRPNFGGIKVLDHDDTKKENRNTKKWENIIEDLKIWRTNGLNSLRFKVIDKKKDNYFTIYKVNL